MMIFHSYVKITRGYPIWSTLYFDPFIPQRKMYHKRAARHPETWLQWVAHPCPKRNIQNIQVAHSRVRSGLVQRQAVKHQKMTRRKVTPSIIKTHMWHVLSIAPFFGGLPQSYPSQCCTSWIMGCWETHIYIPNSCWLLYHPGPPGPKKYPRPYIYIYIYMYTYIYVWRCPKIWLPQTIRFPIDKKQSLGWFLGYPHDLGNIIISRNLHILYIYIVYTYIVYIHIMYIYIHPIYVPHQGLPDCQVMLHLEWLGTVARAIANHNATSVGFACFAPQPGCFFVDHGISPHIIIYIYIMDSILMYIVRGHVCGQYLYINQHNICSGYTIH